ncbi:MAG: 50S ribosomal protein L3 [Candidatus Pacebacteria bacterium]|nr:50S ribosomal protein L3 [Candidatus Paceibacterota bacterium]
MTGIIGKKLGMTQVFEDAGNAVPVTVIEAGPCTVLALRTQDKDGYSAIQLGFGARKAKNVSKAVRGHVRPAGMEDSPPMCIREIRLDGDSEASVGEQLRCDTFSVDDFVDVTGRTKGRGFQGVVKRHGFSGGRASHGGGWMRKPGSIGMCVAPGRVYKGRKMPGQMGNVKRTVQSLRIVGVRPEDNVLLVKGAVPGPAGGIVVVHSARKK